MYEDKTLKCRGCGQDFIFTAGEQEFYQQHSLLHEPGRCPDCRAQRRAGGQADRGPREMHKIICASCGAEDEVPFLPRQDKPVYCSACYDRVRVRR
jgi:CxxC-x17-CxxC domain-containing protein